MSDTFWNDNNIGVSQNKHKQGDGLLFWTAWPQSSLCQDGTWAEMQMMRKPQKGLEKDIPKRENSMPNISANAKCGRLHMELKAIQCGEQECGEWEGGNGWRRGGKGTQGLQLSVSVAMGVEFYFKGSG